MIKIKEQGKVYAMALAVFAMMPFFSQAEEKNVNVTLGPGFPIDENNFLPGDSVGRSFEVENNTDEVQNIMIKFSNTYEEIVNPAIEERIKISIKRVGDGSLMSLPGETLSDLYAYSNPDSAYQNAFFLDTLEAGVGSSREYDIQFTFDPEAGNEYQNLGRESGLIKTIFDIRTGIISSAEEGSAPEAVNDYFKININTPTYLDILSNDKIADSPLDLSGVEIINEPDHGSYNVYTSGSLSGMVEYIPNEGFEGNDFFTYVVKDRDGDLSNDARVDILVENERDDDRRDGNGNGDDEFEVNNEEGENGNGEDDEEGDQDDNDDQDEDEEDAVAAAAENDFAQGVVPETGGVSSGDSAEADEVTTEGEDQSGAGEEEGEEVPTRGEATSCQPLLPFWAWVLAVFIYLLGITGNDYYRYRKKMGYRFKSNLIWGVAGFVFWYYLDNCKEYLWFVYVVVGALILSYLLYHLLIVKRKEKLENSSRE
ncbi:MAG: Ig-like domain-containing protein [Candidatus Moraniibacteriota bacterium]